MLIDKTNQIHDNFFFRPFSIQIEANRPAVKRNPLMNVDRLIKMFA